MKLVNIDPIKKSIYSSLEDHKLNHVGWMDRAHVRSRVWNPIQNQVFVLALEIFFRQLYHLD